jgi:RNA polymerase subunit RPABC4/transcription elongation factor Spt4
MQVKNETQSRLSAGMKIIPAWAWTLAAVGFASAEVVFNIFMRGPDAPATWVRVLLGLLAGTIVGGYFLLIGYVSRDAGRRGMSPLLWTLVAILIPNGLGIILYFILRQPLRRACPQCGNAVQVEFNFCPSCNCKLSPSCPHCQRLVGTNDVYCPYCGTSMRNQAIPESVVAS